MTLQRSPRAGPPTSQANLHIWEITAVQDLFWIGLAVLAIWFGYYLRSIFTPVLIGLILAYIFNPVISYARNHWGLPRPVTISVLISLLMITAIGFMAWLGPVIIEQIVTLAQRLPGYVRSLAIRYDLNLVNVADQVSALASRVQDDPISILQTIFTGTSQAFGFIGTFIGAATYVGISFALIPIYFFFFAWSWLPLTQQMENYLPASQRKKILQISQKMNKAVAGFLRGRLLIALFMAVMFAVGWLLADVPYWFLLGVSAGILSIIPYAAGAAWLAAMLLKYLDVTTGQNTAGFDWMAVVGWPSLVYVVVQIIEGWILTPWVQSDSTDLSPVTVLIVVFIGGALGGLYGLILAIPIAACLKIFAVEILLPRLEQWASKS
ncbi:MAG TPA: AI-2E family transporter [Candidatus Binatia bacterium]|nr:AI-2E family transporter [Candidatus Binatia bacterium]